jgi:hypothetical protein
LASHPALARPVLLPLAVQQQVLLQVQAPTRQA